MSYKLFILFTVIATTCALVRIPIYKSDNFRITPENIQREKSWLLRKYNKDIEDTLVAGELSDDKNLYYYGNILFGTPPQTLTVAFDTSSALLWVREDHICISASDFGDCIYYPGFKSNTSTTFKKLDDSFSFSKGSGYTGEDVVNIFGLEINNQTFGITDYMKISYVYDGVFGLGFQGLTQDNLTPPLYNMISQGVLENPVFSFYFANGLANATTINGGELIIGGSDSSVYSGNLTYLPVISDKYWEFKLSNINLEGLNLCHNCKAVVDTNTYLIGAPAIAFTVLNALLNSTTQENGLSVIDCSIVSSLPDLEIEISGVKYSFPPDLYTTTTTAEIYDYGQHYKTFCVTVIENLGNDYWVLGTPFLEKVYTEFNFDQKTLGFAPYTGTPAAITTTAAPTTTTQAAASTTAAPRRKSTCNK